MEILAVLPLGRRGRLSGQPTSTRGDRRTFGAGGGRAVFPSSTERGLDQLRNRGYGMRRKAVAAARAVTGGPSTPPPSPPPPPPPPPPTLPPPPPPRSRGSEDGQRPTRDNRRSGPCPSSTAAAGLDGLRRLSSHSEISPSRPDPPAPRAPPNPPLEPAEEPAGGKAAIGLKDPPATRRREQRMAHNGLDYGKTAYAHRRCSRAPKPESGS